MQHRLNRPNRQASKLYPKARIIQFSKAPVAAKVKTRLIPSLGPQGAKELHQILSAHVLQVLCQSDLAPVNLSSDQPLDPALQKIAQAYLRDPGFQLVQQQGDNLGARMYNAFSKEYECADSHERASPEGAGLVVLVGSDCPAINKAYLIMAFESLINGSELVLGPAHDGGYVLVGMSRFCPAIFEDVEWGSAEVLQQSLSLAKRAGYQTALLEPLPDIDRPEDLALLPKYGIEL